MSKSFDFVVKAEKVVIKEKGDNNYKVKLAGLSDFLKYQVWSSTNANNINGDRSVFLLRAKDWVEQFKIVNSNSDVSKSFTPTTVIEIDNKSFVQKFFEKSATSNSNIANSAIYMFKDKSLPEIYKLSRHENDISQHLIPKLIGSIKAFPLSGKFIDIGIPERYLKSNL